MSDETTNKMPDLSEILPPHLNKPHGNDYASGFILALVLTIIPFSLVAFGDIKKAEAMVLIVVLAVIQMGVHLRFFLHYSTKRAPIEATIALAFSLFVCGVMIAGCIWVMSDLHYRMMP